MLKVGLTGGIGSGKSTVGRILRLLGVPLFAADEAGRQLLANDPEVHQALRARFGDAVFANGTPDRKAIANIVFNEPKALADLNAIIHPAVRKAFRSWAGEQQAPYVVMEAAILAETGGHSAFDRIVVVSAPEGVRVQRVMRRDGAGEQEVLARMRNQATEEQRLAIADHVIINDDTRLVIPQVIALHNTLRTIQ
ncbi:MAG: dephospho-CoA kinase [Flavobacteriales bacterium]|nr:dephospho-CoA kinase [Flavobacteriales bacterium]